MSPRILSQKIGSLELVYVDFRATVTHFVNIFIFEDFRKSGCLVGSGTLLLIFFYGRHAERSLCKLVGKLLVGAQQGLMATYFLTVFIFRPILATKRPPLDLTMTVTKTLDIFGC